MEQLANPLSQQAGKWLVIRRKPESSKTSTRKADKTEMLSRCRGGCFLNWIPAFAGMTWFCLAVSNQPLLVR